MEERWSLAAKRTIVIGIIIATFVLINNTRSVWPPVAITLILAYILSPIADFFSTRLRCNRTLVVVVIYMILIAVILIIPAMFIPYLITTTENFVEDVPEYIALVGEFFQQPLVFGEFTIEVQDV